VIEADVRVGKGSEGDPIRMVRQYWSLAGKLLAEVDPLKDSEKPESFPPLSPNFPPPIKYFP
jgi:hypothetical protein